MMMEEDRMTALARRFVQAEPEARRVLLRKMAEMSIDFSLLPIPLLHEEGSPIVASHAQRRLFFLWQLDPDSSTYNLHASLHLDGLIDLDALQKTCDDLVRRHAGLRTIFRDEEGEVFQIIEPAAAFPLRIEDLRSLPPETRAAQAAALAEAEACGPFDLRRGPLLRITLLREEEAVSRLLFTLHHIISDGWSADLVVRDFVALYGARHHRQIPPPSCPLAYADYAAWQRSWIDAGGLDDQLVYWTDKLGTDDPPLTLPSDRPRPARRNGAGARFAFSLDPRLSADSHSAAQKQHVTPFMLLLATLYVWLYRATGEGDLRVGVPVANRNRAETESIVGFFVNTQVLRTALDGSTRFIDLVQQVRAVALEAQANQDLPFDRIVEALNPARSLAHNPLFQVKYNYQTWTFDALQNLPDLHVTGMTFGETGAHFDFSLDITDRDGTLTGSVTYACDLFEPATIARIVRQWQCLLRGALAHPEQRIDDLPWLDGDDEEQIDLWGRNPLPLPAASVLALFSGAAAADAKAIAVQCESQRLSYGALDIQSNRLARWLIAAGAGREICIGLCMDRSPAMIVALMAILKAGAVLVPLDPQNPTARLKGIIEECRPLMIFATAETQAALASTCVPVITIDQIDLSAQSPDALAIKIEPEQAAYIIYTSGSTGKPKGVIVSHGALANYIQGVHHHLQMPSGANMAMVSTIAADLGHTMLFGALCHGGTLHLIDAQKIDPDAFAGYMAEQAIDILKIVPSHLSALLQAAEPTRILPRRMLILGGEATSWPLVETLHALGTPCRIVNHYGPTETTVGVLAGSIETRQDCRTAPLGHPLPNTRLHILDQRMNSVPVGMPGEIYIGGAGLARGYAEQPGLTADRFVPDPFDQQGRRLYRTGDRARYREDGTIEFLGRIDEQIKIRGYRVEPGEIAAALRTLPAIRDAAVIGRMLKEGGESHPDLIAYCVPQTEASLDEKDLRIQLSKHLPDPMQPTAFVTLPALPLTLNGKLDRKALPEPQAAQKAQAALPVAPRSRLESRLVEIWQTVLKNDQIGIDDNFFALGGDSILSLQIIARAKRQNIRIMPKDLFEYQTIAELGRVAEWIVQDLALSSIADAAENAPAAAREQEETETPEPFALSNLTAEARARLPLPLNALADLYPLTPMQQGMLLHSLRDPSGGVHINQRICLLNGAFDAAAFRAVWNAALERHAILRTCFLWEGLETPLQAVQCHADMPVETRDWRDVRRDAIEAHLAAFLKEDRRRGFDPGVAPLLRMSIIEIADDSRYLVWTLHHLLLDGWSSARLLDEVFADYAARLFREPNTASASTPVPFRHYIAWLGRQDPAATERFWQQGLAGLSAPTRLTDQVAPSLRREGHGSLVREVPGAFTDLLRGFAQQERVTLNTLLQGALALLIASYTRESDIVFGSVVSGRSAPVAGINDMIGMFINALPIRIAIDPTQKLGPWLRSIQHHNLALRDHEYTPLAEIQAKSGLAYGAPLFDVLLIVQNYPVDPDLWRRIGAVGIEALQTFEQTNYPLTMMAVPREDALRLRLDYDTQFFDAALAEAILDSLVERLRAFTQGPDQRLCDLPVLPAAMHNILIETWNDTAAPLGEAVDLTARMEAMARREPDTIALFHRDGSLTYGEINARANRLARRLRAFGVGPDVLVGLCVDRTPALIIGLWAVLKAGGAYLPLEPTHPPARLAAMLEKARPRVLLTETQWLEPLASAIDNEVAVWCFDRDEAQLEGFAADDLTPLAQPHHLAYCLFTSGSTGDPKGVAISRANLANFLSGIQRDLAIGPSDCVLALTAATFDISTLELVLPLLCGARVALAGRRAAHNPRRLLAFIETCGVTIAQATPSAWHMLSQSEDFEKLSLRLGLCGGEALPEDLAARLLSCAGEVWNLYGPTETTIWSLHHRLDQNDPRPLIGLPFDNTRAYVLDAALESVPPGVTGELYIGGAGLARGYWRHPGLTAERFVPDPFHAKGSRLYRTGDLARRHANGALEFIGRADQQIKIRGVRIEPAEIETCLLRVEGIRAAIVTARRAPGGLRLVAYIIGDTTHPDWRERLENHLRRHLPDAMIPARFVALETMPLNVSGKLDRNALPDPEWQSNDYVPPQTELECKLAAIWREVLHVERISLTDNFFELGGHSLLAAQATAKIRTQLAIDMPFDRLFEAATLSALAGSLHHQEADGTEDIAFMTTLLAGLEASGTDTQ